MKATSGTSWVVAITLLALAGGLLIYSYADLPGARYFGISDKNFWDYLKLLIVPAALAFGVYWLNRTQDIRQQEADDLQQMRQEELNDLQQRRTLEMVDQQAQDAALRAYLDQMSQLMLEQELSYAEPGIEGPSANRLALARARTLTVLPTLDANRKRSVLQFLYEADLINVEHTLLTEGDLIERRHNIVSLQQADLTEAYLGGANLSRADLRGADLSGADLRGTNLSWANLSRTNLERANLRRADLTGANLSEAKLTWADLKWAKLTRAHLYEAHLYEAHLSRADLSKANLGRANLGKTDLYAARLYETHLTYTYLKEANLSDVVGVTNEEIEEKVDLPNLLEDATMPNGQKYEDWLKDREDRKEDVESD